MTAEYLEHLAQALRDHGVDRPVAVVDLDRVDGNCDAARAGLGHGLQARLVAKSLPCLPLLDHIRARIPTSGLMSFSEPMLSALLAAEPDTDHLLGKPLQVTAARRVLEAHPDAARRVQWLIDTQQRLDAYLSLAADTGQTLRLSLEIDVGLHRGGLTPDQVAGVAARIADHAHAALSGVMGYEVHLAKLPAPLRRRARRASATAFGQAVAALGQGAQGLCLNTGGSLTFQDPATRSLATEVAFGSVLVKPSDFDHASTGAFLPALFLATPILKVMPRNPVPGIDLPGLRRTNLAISGGHYLAGPVWPEGFGYSGVFGRSSNQEVWVGPKTTRAQPGDIALLRPSQSEAVLNQFGTVLALRQGRVVAEWACLPN